jgi:glycosyltransferase involved in cell wall biosynthesis
MRIIHVTHFEPKPFGHGGFHRTYQIWRDLAAEVGEENITRVSVRLPWWSPYIDPHAAPEPPMLNRIRRNPKRLTEGFRYARRARHWSANLVSQFERTTRALRDWSDNPYKLFARNHFTIRGASGQTFRSQYQRVIEPIGAPALCVLEHTSFADVIALNRQRGIPTVCCPHNLESFDLMAFDRRRSLKAAAVDFANEIRVLEQGDARLFISQVETALVSGLGLGARYYPYLPVAEIRAQHLKIRAERCRVEATPGLFVMLGSAEHATTREAFTWFIEQAQTRGLPQGARVVVGGSATDTLLPKNAQVPGIELRGWLEQAELDELLRRAQAALIPQRRGFGALTRLPEFACAGIPVIVSRHPTAALDLPPGARIA